MILYVNGNQEIKDVDKTSDKSLTPLLVTDPNNPFKDWSVAKICCYKVTVSGGVITMFTPYVDSRLIDHIDQLGASVEAVTPYEATESVSAGETEVTFLGVPDGITMTTTVKDLEGHMIAHNVSRTDDIVRIIFEPLTYAADVYLTVN